MGSSQMLPMFFAWDLVEGVVITLIENVGQEILEKDNGL